MPELGVDSLATEPIAGDYLYGLPVVALVAQPEAFTPNPTFTFSYSAFAGRAQVWHQYEIRTLGGVVLHQSGQRAPGTSFQTSYLLSDGATYVVAVRAFDGHQISEWSTITVAVTLDDPTDFPLNTEVGSVYEIAVNGIGYMLSDDPGDRIIRRQTYAVDQPRFATGSTPFAEAVDRYSFGAFSDWRGGAGQKFAHRPDSLPNRFSDSWLIDPFGESGLTLLHTIAEVDTGPTALAPHAVVAGGELLVACASTETNEMYWRQANGTDGTFAITGAAAGDCTSLVSDGTNWYYANGSSIWKGTGHTNPGGADSALDATVLCWAVDRLAAVYTSSSRIRVTTFDDSFAEEVTNGRFSYLSADVTIPAMTAGDGYLWWLVNRTDTTQVHFWQIGSEDTFAANALTLPAGQQGLSLFFYLGNVMLATVEEPGPGCVLRIYRCVPQDGVLTPELVIERRLAASSTTVRFTGAGRQVLFTWEEYDPDGVVDTRGLGTGCFDLASGGWARWLAPAAADGASTGGTVVSWNGQLVLAGDNETKSLYIETTDFEPEGALDHSGLDFASGIRKQAVELSTTIQPLPADTAVELLVSLDQGASFTSVGEVSTAGSKRGSWGYTKRFDQATVRATLTSDGTATPTVNLVQLKVHPVATVDQLVQFPVRVGNNVRGLNGAPIPTIGLDRSGAGWAAYTIQSLSVGQQVQLQDVDWPHTGLTSIWEVVEVDARLHGQFVPAENRRVDTGTVLLTLRRSA